MDKAHASHMLSIFQRAIPEITSRATLFFVDKNPYIFPGSGEKVKLEKYQIGEPEGIGAGFEFTIARLLKDGYEIVFTLSFKLEEYPERKFYVKEWRMAEAVILYTLRGFYPEEPATPP